VDTLVAGHKLMRRIFASNPLSAQVVGEYKPGAEYQSDDRLRDYVRSNSGGVYHPAGTCKMGNDTQSVVDSKLRVRGVDSLYAADASVMPFVVSANLNATCIMIGERLGEWLKESA
jgi:choline dehydrogenase